MLAICPMSAYSNNNENPNNEKQTNIQPEGKSKIIVVYFSQSGTTRGITPFFIFLGIKSNYEKFSFHFKI